MKIAFYLSLLLVTATIGDSAADAADATGTAGTASSKACFKTRTMHNFHALSDKELIIWSPFNKAFLVTLRGACDAQDARTQLSFIGDPTGRVCGRPGDRVMIAGRSCHLDSVRALDKEQADALMKGKKGTKADNKGQ